MVGRIYIETVGTLLVVVLCLFVSTVKGGSSKPVLTPSGQLIKKKGDTLTLKCSGNSRIYWDYEASEDDPRFRIVQKESDGKYESTLTLDDLMYLDRQMFICSYNPNFNGEVEIADVYIDDPDHLLVTTSVGIDSVTLSKGNRNVIPYCRATHPQVNLKLTNFNSGDDVRNEIGSRWSYTLSEGFVIDPATSLTAGYYTCRAERDQVTEELTLIVFVTAPQPILTHPPTINSTLAQAIPVGGTFKLDCTTESDKENYFYMNWTQPIDVIESGRATIEQKEVRSHHKRFRTTLTVRNATIQDAEKIYVCSVVFRGINYSANDTVSIFLPGNEYIEVNSSSGVNITANASKEPEAIWKLNVFGFPRPNEFYLKNFKGIDLITGVKSRYNILYQIDRNEVFIEIHQFTIQDSGLYYFTVGNGHKHTEKTVKLFLTVTDRPRSQFLGKRKMYYTINSTEIFSCKAEGYPYPNITWSFINCLPESIVDEHCMTSESIEPTHQLINKAWNDAPRCSEQATNYTIKGTGFLNCMGLNNIGYDAVEQLIVAIDFPDDGQIGQKGFGIHSGTNILNYQPIEGSTVGYICSGSILNYTNEIHWYYQTNNQSKKLLIEPSTDIDLIESKTKWSYSKELRLYNVNSSIDGIYRCEIRSNKGEAFMQSIDVMVLSMKPATISDTNLNQDIIRTGSTWTKGKLYCIASGVPLPLIQWYKDDELIQDIPKLKDEIIVGKDYIDFKGLTSDYNGRYKCTATNEKGTAERYVDIAVEKEANIGLIFGLIGLGIACFIVSVIAAYQYYRDQKMKRWRKKLGLKEFETGDVERINPEQGVESQVNLLPYDKKFEFPRERLKIGVRIGSGAFGEVLVAEAVGIKQGESMTKVAVKRVKSSSDESHVIALMSELKIMIHLGPHVNVVNLLGACTKQLCKKRELLVIVEYCKYGSLLSYLHRHRDDFIDQLDRNLDIIDPDIGFVVEEDICNPSQRLNYAALTFTDNSNLNGNGITNHPLPNGYHTMVQLQMNSPVFEHGPTHRPTRHTTNNIEDYALSTNVQSVCTDMSYVSNFPTTSGTTDPSRHRSSSTCTWNGHYRGIYHDQDVQPITTSNLLCWTFQIARGMEFLASRNVLHGDLAARNVLLADNNVVKICDFGLAREMYEEKYKKKSEVPLPVKWMAIESIGYRVFSTQSDVWSFGVVMWELFTLGKNPYPGMEADEQFYISLTNGYRMEKPQFAPTTVYELMMSCWDKEPSCRPSFSGIADRIGDLMDDRDRKHYIDLNIPYLNINQERLEGQEDYLGKMSGADFSSVSRRATPDRTYSNCQPQQMEQGGYLIPKIPGAASNYLVVPGPSYDNYQNIFPNSNNFGHDPRLQCLANNTGYVYMNKDENSLNDIVPCQSSKMSTYVEPSTKLHNVTKEESNSNFNTVPTSFSDDVQQSTNYEPSNCSQMALPNSNNDNLQIEHFAGTDHNCFTKKGDECSTSEGPLDTRHKNDSGVSSIDSNYEGTVQQPNKSPPILNPTNIWNGGHLVVNNDLFPSNLA